MEKTIRISDKNISYNINYRNIKYPRLEFKTGDLLLVLPRKYGDEKELLEKHRAWIIKKSNFINNTINQTRKIKLNLKRNEKQFKILINGSIKEFSNKLGIMPQRICFKCMKSKWGSLSFQRSLTVNSLLKYLPLSLIKYVIYHEMVHLLERKHNDSFWRFISRKYKNHQKYETSLLKYWFLIQKAKLLN